VLSDLTNSTETDLSDERIAAIAFSPDGDWFASALMNVNTSRCDMSRNLLIAFFLLCGLPPFNCSAKDETPAEPASEIKDVSPLRKMMEESLTWIDL
jgi:hypothetical protein